ILLALVLVIAVSLGTITDVTILVTSLGLFNVAVFLFLLLRKDITWGFLFYLTAVIFFQTGFWIRLPAFPDLYPARIASMLLFLIFFVQLLLGMRRAPKLGAIEKTMLIFLVIMIISILTSGQKKWLMLMRGYMYPFLFFYFARAVVRSTSQMKIVFSYLAFVGIYFAVMGIFEKMHWYGLVWPRFIVDPTLADHGLTRLGFRVRGIFLQPAVLGCVMTIGFFPAWHYLSRARGIFPMIVRLILLVTTPMTIFFTQTRSVYLGFALTLLISAGMSRKFRPLAVGLILAAGVGVMANWDNLSGEDREKGGMGTMNTVEYRVMLLYETAEIFMDEPLFGVGFMNFEEAALQRRKPRDVPFFGHVDHGVGGIAVSHNILVTIIAEQGLTGIVPYVLIFVLMLRRAKAVYRRFPKKGLVSRDYVVCVWCAIAAYIANSMFLEMRYFEYVNVLFFFLIGGMIGLDEAMQERPQEVPEAARRTGPAWRRTVEAT
ncbi:O-antigen ligase family protein, partial [bacterium]|nr:O-antigen ligase family protein [bacterium]